ncbi:hypothetical protein EK21DRAFT_89629 [Setomelanomma holmii]|uniref:Uncharacterized protein n=1 Tax=Setomelanomma holmii TaxID=210430 RepID=A0A9P4H8I8_9PLEO|nr:hypothetical protein EK21DRAFT_89629 [Setomelanomma holmii]
MASFDKAKSLLTRVNVQAWAPLIFCEAFYSLPPLETVIFVDVDDTTFDRTVRRSLGRSVHKKLLVVGAYSPGSDVEDVEVCAHIHDGEHEVTLYRIEEPDDKTLALRPVTSTGHVALYPPFTDVGDDFGRVFAIFRYYFLAAGYINELVMHKNAPRIFTRKFDEACRWVANGGE